MNRRAMGVQLLTGIAAWHSHLAIAGRPFQSADVKEAVRRELLTMKVPTTLIEAKLHLPANQIVTASYEDDAVKAGSGEIELGDPTIKRRRIIYGDDPK